jgi:hypothetical protein
MKVTQCPTHAQILDAAREEMAANQRFMKASVLQATGLKPGLWTKKIQWPYIRTTIEAELGNEALTPIPATNGRWDPQIHPEKFLPGAKRPTAGYARASVLVPEVAFKYLERRYSNVRGNWDGFQRLASSYQKQGLAIGFHPMTLPPLELPQGHSPTA